MSRVAPHAHDPLAMLRDAAKGTPEERLTRLEAGMQEVKRRIEPLERANATDE